MSSTPSVRSKFPEELERSYSGYPSAKIPFVDLSRQNSQYKYEIKIAINRVLESGRYTSGEETAGFENEFAFYCGATFCIGVSSGIKAIEIGLRAIGIQPGDGVLTVANAGMHSTSAIQAIGAIPQFVEIDPITLNMDAESLEACITERSRAVVITHLHGRMADIKPLKHIADRYHLQVVEDCFQATGANFNGKKLGTFGVLGCFCFSPASNLGALGEVGAIITDDLELAAAARVIRLEGNNSGSNCTVNVDNSALMNEIQAAILRSKLPMLDEWNLRRRMVAQTYMIHLGTSNSELDWDYPAGSSVFQHFVVRSPQRGQLQTYLQEIGIETEVHYPLPDHIKSGSSKKTSAEVRLPQTEKACNEVLSLPCYPELRSWEIQQICMAIKEYFGQMLE